MTVISLPLTAAEALHEKTACEIDKRALARDSDGDLKVSIKRGLPRARQKFLCDRSRISLWSICAPHIRFSLYRRAIGRRKRLSCFTSTLALRLRNRLRRKSGTRLLRARLFACDACNSRRQATYKLFYELMA